MRLAAIAIAATALALAAPSSDAAAPSAAAATAMRWVALVDRGGYDRSWSESGAIFRARTPQAAWAAAAAPVRQALGMMIERKLVVELDAETLSGLPGRGFKIVTFQTQFANDARASESVTLRREGGVWKVEDYNLFD